MAGLPNKKKSERGARMYLYVNADQFNNIKKMKPEAMELLNAMCKEAMSTKNWKHIINSDYRENDTGRHGKGEAIDIVFFVEVPGDVNVIEQFIFALRFKWGGVGFYPYWNTRGLHCDSRPWETIRALWWRGKKKSKDKEPAYHRADILFEKLKWIA